MTKLEKLRADMEATRCLDCGLGLDLNHTGCNQVNRRTAFIKVLAKYLAGNQVTKSIQLQAGQQHAKEWAELRNATPLFGYPTIEEAERVLSDFLR